MSERPEWRRPELTPEIQAAIREVVNRPHPSQDEQEGECPSCYAMGPIYMLCDDCEREFA